MEVFSNSSAHIHTWHTENAIKTFDVAKQELKVSALEDIPKIESSKVSNWLHCIYNLDPKSTVIPPLSDVCIIQLDRVPTGNFFSNAGQTHFLIKQCLRNWIFDFLQSLVDSPLMGRSNRFLWK